MDKNILRNSAFRFVLLLVAMACVFIIISGIQSSAYIINSILLAGIIALAVLPLPLWLIRRGMNPKLAVVLTLIVILAVLVGLFMLVYTSLDSVAADLSAAEAAETTTQDSTSDGSDLMAQIEEFVNIENVNQMLGSLVSATGQIVAQFLAVGMIFIFMLSTLIITPISNQMKDSLEGPTAERLRQLTKDVQKYISMTTLINFLVGLGNAIFLLILDVPFAILWGIFSWLMGYIPAIGFWVAMIPPVLIAWVTMDLRTAAIVFIGYVVINGSVENFVKPKVMGQGLNLPPLVVFVSLFFWAWLLGAIGAILAVPLTMMILSVLDSFDATRWVVVLMRSSSSSEEHEKVEASGKLNELWGRVTSVIRRHDDEDHVESEGA